MNYLSGLQSPLCLLSHLWGSLLHSVALCTDKCCAAGSPVSHCFALSDGSGHPGGCIGVSGIMAAYNAGLSTCRLSGPTHFGSVLDAAVGTVVAADVSQFNQKYFVLLIITDG